ncbi:MAG: hypothetical protein ACRCUY_11790 [Thermoguttaceae bacterium]
MGERASDQKAKLSLSRELPSRFALIILDIPDTSTEAFSHQESVESSNNFPILVKLTK